MAEMRQAIKDNQFEEYRKEFYRCRESVTTEPIVQDVVN